MSSLLLSVSFADSEVDVMSSLTLCRATRSIEWLAKKTMSVTRVTVDGRPAKIAEEGDVDAVFMPECRKYRLESESPFSQLEVDLRGQVSGWMDKVTEDFRYLSMYSVWYPAYQRTEGLDVTIRILDCEDFDVLKAEYDPDTREWHYGGKGFSPYEVIAFRKNRYAVIGDEFATIYFADRSEKPAAEVILRAVGGSLGFLNGGLFEKRQIGRYDIVSAGGCTEFAGYARKELIVYDKLPTVPKDTEMCVAHEIAHEWCSGAETTTYEDWLNETTAEWSAILYGMSIGIDAEYILGPTMDRYERWAKDKPPIISEGTKRSIGGAQRGILMFGEVFREHGIDKIRELLSLFVGLESKTTDSFLRRLRATDQTIADSFEYWLRAEPLPSACRGRSSKVSPDLRAT